MPKEALGGALGLVVFRQEARASRPFDFQQSSGGLKLTPASNGGLPGTPMKLAAFSVASLREAGVAASWGGGFVESHICQNRADVGHPAKEAHRLLKVVWPQAEFLERLDL
jgi:hypothetical protein